MREGPSALLLAYIVRVIRFRSFVGILGRSCERDTLENMSREELESHLEVLEARHDDLVTAELEGNSGSKKKTHRRKNKTRKA